MVLAPTLLQSRSRADSIGGEGARDFLGSSDLFRTPSETRGGLGRTAQMYIGRATFSPRTWAPLDSTPTAVSAGGSPTRGSSAVQQPIEPVPQSLEYRRGVRQVKDHYAVGNVTEVLRKGVASTVRSSRLTAEQDDTYDEALFF